MRRPNLKPQLARARLPALLLASALAFSVSSCGLFSSFNNSEQEKQKRADEVTRLQFEVMRLSDQVLLDLGASARQFSRQVGTPEAKQLALTWSVSHTNRVLSIASNPKPLNALVDLLLYVSVQRIFHEEYWLPEVHGEADRPMLESLERLETACWKSLRRVLNDKQEEALRKVLSTWREQNPDLRAAAMVESPSFARALAPATSVESGERVPLVSDLFDLLSLDPLAGLEPAVQEVATTRALGERMFFFAQHMPRLLQQEVELTTMRTANLPEVRSGLENAERFVATAEALPAAVRAEREATLRQVSEELTAQRKGLLADLEQAREPLHTLLADGRETLDAGTRASESIQTGIAALDGLVSRWPGSDENAPSTSEPSRPFDVRDYGEAAASIGAAAQRVTVAITTADQNLPEVQKTFDEAALRVERSVDHAYGRALSLVLWSIALVSVAVLAVRVVWLKLPPRSADRSSNAADPSGSHRGRQERGSTRATRPGVDLGE